METDVFDKPDEDFLKENAEDSFKPMALQEKLTNWKNEPTVETLKEDLRLAEQTHSEQVNKIDKWTDLIDVTGSAKPKAINGRSSVQPKLIRRQAEWRYSALTEPFLSSFKLFKVSPKTFEDVDAAKQNELLLNWQFSTKINKVKFIDDYIRATVDEGTSIVRIGWNQVTKPKKEKVPVYEFYPVQDEQTLQVIQQALELKQQNPRAYNEQAAPELKASIQFYEEQGVPAIAQVVGEEVQDSEEIVENHPTVEVLDPHNVYVDPTCNGDFNKALFVITSFETNKADLLASGLYKNLDAIDWKATSTDNIHKTDTPSLGFKDTIRNRIVAYEYWGFYDINGTGELKPIVATWVNNVLIRLEENPYPDGKLPFVIVPYMPLKRSLYGETDAELLEDNQKILGAVTRGMIDLMGRSANAQRGIAKGLLDPTNRRKYEAGSDYEFNSTMNPIQGIIEHRFPEIPQSAMLMVQMQNQEAEALTGVKSFSGGLGGNAYGDVAAGVRGMLDAASKREMAILRRLAHGMQEIGDKIIAMNSEFLTEEEVIRVTNTEFVKIKQEDLKGNFDLEVDINTAEIDNSKAQDMGFMLQTLGPALDPSMTKLIMAEIAELKRMPDLAEKIRTFQPQPDPVEQQLNEIKVQLAQLNLQKLQAEIEFISSRATKTQAEAESVAVDTQAEVTGVKHQQAIEKQQAQAKGNEALEITKAILHGNKAGDPPPDVDGAIGFSYLNSQLQKQAEQLNSDMDANRLKNNINKQLGSPNPLAPPDPMEPSIYPEGYSPAPTNMDQLINEPQP